MVILGLDIGYDRCGFAVIDAHKKTIIDSGLVLTAKTLDFAKRLKILRKDLLYIKNKYNPEGICLERLFFNRKNETFERICMSKGVVLELFCNTRILEVEPLKVKREITGVGNASKYDMKKALSQRLNLNFDKYIDDEIDAICLGLYFAEHLQFEKLYNHS